MAVSWQTIQSLLIFLGPWLLPRALGFYRSIRNRPPAQIRPLPHRTQYALAVLFASATVAFLSTLPYFAPENIFRATQSRLQTQPGVLFARLGSTRLFTAQDERLREVLDKGGLDARLLYARYGPHVLADCPFATPGEVTAGRDYLFYAAVTILAPHIFHLIALGIATSGVLSGKEGARWRTIATIAGVLLGTAELWLIANYDDRYNMRSTRLSEVDFIHWKMQVWRGLAVAAIDGILGWVIWLQATRRTFLTPASAAERLLDHAQALEKVLSKTRNLGIIKNGSIRDAELRRRVDGYWSKDQEVMRDMFEQPEVIEAQRNALKRIDITAVGRQADQYIDTMLNGIQIAPAAMAG